jgi:hypothetical protein
LIRQPMTQYWLGPVTRAVFGLAIAIIGLKFFQAAPPLWAASQQLRSSEATVEGVVESIDPPGLLATTYPAIYQFKAGGRTITKWEIVRRGTALEVDSPVTVRYVPDNPALSVVDGSRALYGTSSAMTFSAVLIYVLAISLLITAVPSRRFLDRVRYAAPPPAAQRPPTLRLVVIMGLVILNLLALNAAIRQYITWLEARSMGVVVEAEVQTVYESNPDRPAIDFAFDLPDGERIEQTIQVSPGIARADKIRVQYAPTNPRNVGLAGRPKVGFLVFAGLGSIGLFFLIFTLIPRPPRGIESPNQQMIDQLEELVQAGLERYEPLAGRHIHVRLAEDGRLLFDVEGQIYTHIEHIPDETVRVFLQKIVVFWNQRRR